MWKLKLLAGGSYVSVNGYRLIFWRAGTVEGEESSMPC
jgi:hypothetical protein